ncbi:MAG: proline--tRNA ligase [Sterolibacterium sp.]|jgi:prolyl-tRNA synthetase
MRASQFFIATLKEAPNDAEIISHQLMLRAGLIRRLAGGIYTWMPLGLRVLRKVEAIVREEMNRAGALELFMPAVQPAELWQESGRWDKYGPELLRFKDRHQRDFVMGPTHEEVITDIVRREIKSYRQLPRHFYQIQTKFRDEIRPRFGIMRGREFLMKDGYSFHTSFEDLQREYRNMYDTYGRIFTRLGLKFRAVAADTGSIGGTGSHEFHVLADSGEDAIAFCPAERSDYAANVELAEALAPSSTGSEPLQQRKKVATPGARTIEEVSNFLGVSPQRIVKSLLVITTTTGTPYLLLLRGDHELNEIKTQKVIGEFRFARDDEIEQAFGCRPGYIGPFDTHVSCIVDRTVASMTNFVCGPNDNGHHYIGANFGSDGLTLNTSLVHDIRNVVSGDPSPDGKGTLEICRGIEVGHIFQLRTKYAEALKCTFLNEQGQPQIMEMGCYGIGVTRIVGAAIEQGNDPRGIIFPRAIAPFEAVVVPMGYAKSEAVRAAADKLYADLAAAGVDVMLDDRDERPGVMFADWELVGVPHRFVVGERGLKEGKIEYKGRCDADATLLATEQLTTFIRERLCA